MSSGPKMILAKLSPLLRIRMAQKLSRRALLAMQPEIAHSATITALRLGLGPVKAAPDPAPLSTEIAGLNLANPVGMAAGFDKNAQVCGPLGEMGFGMVEVGTLTPRPQSGNPRPRLFRLSAREAIINRMGFNNCGHAAACERLRARHFRTVVGVNIGANKDASDFVADYVQGVKIFAPAADYLALNISSPNTPGLRDLQDGEALRRLLGEVLAERARAPVRVPVFLKLAPDLDQQQMDAIAGRVLATDLDGLIVSNTTISRPGLAGSAHAGEGGGLSGRPLFNLANRRLAQMRQRVGPKLPIIGVGGIHSGASALAKFAAGANAIQLYSALIFGGLELLDEIKQTLAGAARGAGAATVSELTGTAVGDWASGHAKI